MPKLYTREEARRRKVKFQVFAGMFDFLAIVAGILVLVACIVLLVALVRWVIGDVPVTFHKLWETFMKAIIIPESIWRSPARRRRLCFSYRALLTEAFLTRFSYKAFLTRLSSRAIQRMDEICVLPGRN